MGVRIEAIGLANMAAGSVMLGMKVVMMTVACFYQENEAVIWIAGRVGIEDRDVGR